jgi:hypothetical protein
MKKVIKIFFIISIIELTSVSCLDPYDPPKSNSQTDFVVIDGHINSTKNEIIVKIGKSISLSDTDGYPPVTKATVFVEDNTNQFVLVSETNPGVYSTNYSFDSNREYRIKVTINGIEYVSDYIQLQNNNPIDSLTWKADNQYFEIFSNTQDLHEGHKFYRYNFDETYEYNSVFASSWKYVNTNPVYRTPEDYIYTCWLTQPSSNIIVTSTENLVSNTITNFPIVRIAKGDRRLWHQYSLLVRQYSIDKAAYEYWSQVSKLTESLGGLFDPIPYPVKGNIRAQSNPEEIVLGYFSGGAVSEKRIVVRNNQMPLGYTGVYLGDCAESYIEVSEVSSIANNNIILTRAEYMAIFIIGFYYSSPNCVDCRLGGGTNVKPDFMF